jgi:acetoin utilization protein AcuA
LGEERADAVLETPRGKVFIRCRADADFVAGLRLAPGMGAFSGPHFPAAREHKALIRLAGEPESNVTIAYNEEGEIVGFVAIAPPSQAERWGRLKDKGLVEAMAIEVSDGWRGMGIASTMMDTLLEDSFYDDKIVMCTGYSWHWDLQRLGVPKERYREMLLRYLEKAGFVYYDTDEPNIAMDPANFLAARIGPKVSRELYTEFDRLLFSEGTWGSVRGMPRPISHELDPKREREGEQAVRVKRGWLG